MSLQVCIMAPDRVFWNEEATEIILPTNTGQMGVLKKPYSPYYWFRCWSYAYSYWYGVDFNGPNGWFCFS